MDFSYFFIFLGIGAIAAILFLLIIAVPYFLGVAVLCMKEILKSVKEGIITPLRKEPH